MFHFLRAKPGEIDTEIRHNQTSIMAKNADTDTRSTASAADERGGTGLVHKTFRNPDGEEKYLLFGKNGWIGGMLIELLRKQGKRVVLASSRLENRESVKRELEEVKPSHVLDAAGVTGRPNIDWCETNQQATLRTNVIGTLNLADLCDEMGIHLTLFATGCIFEYDDAHPMYSGKGFTEEDKPNFDGSFYSKTKGFVEEMLKSYKTTLTLRVRMPISDDLGPRNFLTKIMRYDKVVNIPNSMTILTDLLPISLVMAERGIVGICNFTNPGVISHNECLDLYIKYIDPGFTYTNFTVAEQDKILAARRSNNELDTTKFQSLLPDIELPHIQESMCKVFSRMRVNMEEAGACGSRA
jgi:3,5-epimerase/4-reductase